MPAVRSARSEIPLALLREAYHAAGEKRWGLGRVLYPALFGRRWRAALLLFSYLKCVDDAVDENPDPAAAARVLEAQRALIERVYAEPDAAGEAELPGAYGAPLFAWDARRGGRLRPHLAAVLATMEFDLRRRGRALSGAELDAYALQIGGAVLRALFLLLAPRAALPDGLVAAASRAYVEADCLIDLDHDLALGLINVPREALAAFGIDPARPDERLRAWESARGPVVARALDEALAGLREGASPALRLLLRLVLGQKRRKLRKHLGRSYPV